MVLTITFYEYEKEEPPVTIYDYIKAMRRYYEEPQTTPFLDYAQARLSLYDLVERVSPLIDQLYGENAPNSPTEAHRPQGGADDGFLHAPKGHHFEVKGECCPKIKHGVMFKVHPARLCEKIKKESLWP
jgi:hypothetical protein